MGSSFSVAVANHSYRVLRSPHVLTDTDGVRCMGLVDHQDSVIWIDPSVPAAALAPLVASLVAQAWREATAIPLVA